MGQTGFGHNQSVTNGCSAQPDLRTSTALLASCPA